MKFDNPQFDLETKSCNFLDIKISIENGIITTDLFKKPTDIPSVLLPSSSHPGHISPNIVYSMAFRLLRICSSTELFETRLTELKMDVLIPRQYKPSVIEAAFNRVRQITREEALKKIDQKEKHKKNEGRIICPFDYNPRIKELPNTIKKHHNGMLRKNPSLKEALGDNPMAALRQGKNLRRLICRAKLYPLSNEQTKRTYNTKPGWKACQKYGSQCPICPYTFGPTSEIKGLASGYTHKINDNVNCQDKNILYYWRCTKTNCKLYPKCEYIGKSINSFQKRFSAHRDYVKRGILTEPSGEHFSQKGHNVSHMKGLILEKVKDKDPYVLKAREHMYISKFDTFRNGLNRER